MGKSQHQIEILATIKTSLEGLDETVKKLQSKLKSGDLQIDLTKGVGKDLSKLISNFETGFSKIKQMTPDNMLQIVDSKEFQKEGNNIIKTITEIQRIAGDLGTKNLLDAKKLFPNSFDSRITELSEKINSVGSTLETLGKKQAKFDQLNAELAGLTAQLNELEEAANNIDAIRQKANDADTALEQSKKKVEELRASLIKDIELKFSTDKIEEVKKAAEASRKELENLEKQGVSKSSKGKAVYQGKGIGEWRGFAKGGTNEQKAQAEAAIKLLQTYNDINTSLSQQNKFLSDNEKIQKLINSPEGINNEKSLKAAANVMEQSDSIKRALEERTRATERASQAQADLTRAENASANTQKINQDIAQKTQAIKELEVIIRSLKDNSSLTELTAKFNEIANMNLAPTKENLAVMAEELKKIDGKAYEDLKAVLSSLGIVLPETKEQIQGVRRGFEDAGDKVNQFNDRLRETDQLKQKIQYFFGLTNSIQLFKRAVTSALNTVKELDKTMTEAAVVTEFDIGDMWDKLPQYANQAQKLGVSINDMYQATTLYYQQGLKTNEAMQLGIETMKMAKIAGIESADATKAMTAALRGFNMELNETSATRVNDVYSQLAAVTAADTKQIATAMGKTASIAASANMEFETTAALLAQIIETTQEAPETAGTAMKTIVARFSEVKKLREAGQISGQDEDGEVIDVNKIQTALRTVGISMDGFFSGTEGLGTILLELSKKWNDLSVETQRYIATMAAGSRQQSRFIAMMSDYKRTMELVGAANNSAGASQRQYEKTLDSMDTKLTNLKNAWQEFTMGLTNNEILKGAVDFLTFLLNSVNNLTEAISGGSGLAKSIVNLLTVIGVLKGGQFLSNKMFHMEQPLNIFKGGLIKKDPKSKEDSQKHSYNSGKKRWRGIR